MSAIIQTKRCQQVLARDWNDNHFDQILELLREITVKRNQPHALYDPAHGLTPEEVMDIDELKRGLIKLWDSYLRRSPDASTALNRLRHLFSTKEERIELCRRGRCACKS